MKAASRRPSADASFVVLRRGGAAAGGRVTLVGAGPGDPELLTLRAARRIAEADVVVHDGLVPAAILDLAKPGARRISVAKRKARHTVAQDDIHSLLIGLALQGFDVVRLKGGDPFVFGRGGEELEACRAAGVDCQVIPGVTAALAAAAAVGAPLTHRVLGRAVTLVSGHAAGEADDDLDWAALAAGGQTLAVYMGLGAVAQVAERLMAAGRAAATPVVVVENASLPRERRIGATLAGLAEACRGLDGPALLLIGEVAALAEIEPGRRVDAGAPLANAS